MSGPASRASLPPLSVAGRVDRLRARLDEAGCDELLVTDLTNVRWLTGFTGSNGLAVVGPDRFVFVTDGRYGEQAAAELAAAGAVADVEVTASRSAHRAAMIGLVAATSRLGLEADEVTWAQQRTWDADWFPDAELVATVGLVAGLRRVKDDAEVARLEAAAGIADAALGDVRHVLYDGPTEVEFATTLERRMADLGADDTSFDTIVAAGPNSARPHHRAGHRRIETGDLVVLDFGALVDGYHSDMTRTLCIGEPTAAQAELVDAATAAHHAGVAVVRDGCAVLDLDGACRRELAARGLEELFVHGTGHGVGLQIHETPIVHRDAESAEKLSAGEVVTVEPGVYRPGVGGARTEDTVLVTADGCRPLNRTPKDVVA